MTYEEHTNLMLTPTWSYKEIMLYCHVKKSKAFLIMKACKEKLNGKVLFNEHKVKRDSVLAYAGSSIEREKLVNRELRQKENEVDEG